VKNYLDHLVDYTIEYFRQIKKKYGQGKERRTELRSFASIEATKVVVANQKLYMNAVDGFIGTSLRKDEYVCDCSDIDDIILFLKDGTYTISKVAEKQFVGKDIIHAAVFKKNDSRTIYNLAYFDGNSGNVMVKRAPVTGITRDKQYNIAKEHKHTKILYFSANPNGEAEVIKVYLRPRPRLKNTIFEYDFADLAIKGRDAMGNILTKFSVQKIVMKEKGVSTLGGRKIWFDEDVMRLNVDARGIFLGEFSGEDQILVITRSGYFRTGNFDLSNHFEDDLLLIEKYRSEKIWSAAYFDAEQNYYYLKRFLIDPGDKPTRFIGDHPDSRLIRITEVEYPRLELKFGGKNKDRDPEIIEVAEFIGVKSYKARGKRLSKYEVKVIQELTPESEQPDKPKEQQADKPKEEKQAKAGEQQQETVRTEARTPVKKEKDSSKPVKEEAPEVKAEKPARPATSAAKSQVSKDKRQDPDDVPLEIIKPEEEKEDKGKKDSGGQFTLEW
jgi:topoisomerase-4 subunit A